MLKRNYGLIEAAEYLSAETGKALSTRDVLDSVARGEIRACFWFAGGLTLFRDDGLDEKIGRTPLEFRGYLQIPASSVSPNGDISPFDRASIIEVTKLIAGEPMPSDLTCGRHFVGSYDMVLTDDDIDIRAIPFEVCLDEIVIPARDLLDLTPRNQSTEKPVTTTERNSQLTIIAALCDRLGINHQERGAASRIAKMTEEIGAPVSDDTVRRVLAKIPGALESRMK